MAKKKINNGFRRFESSKERDHFARVSKSMMNSKAWQAISIHARYLYLEFKFKYYGKPDQRITFTYLEADNLMQRRTFTKCIDELISHGFIICEFNGQSRMMKSEYTFSDAWIAWPAITTRTRKFTIPHNPDTEQD